MNSRPLFVVDEETGEIFPIPQGGAEGEGEGEGEGGGEGETGDKGGEGEGEKKTGAWRAQLPDDLKENEVFTKFEKLGDLGKDYLDLKGKAAKSIPIPGDDASDDEKNAFFTQLGRPEKPDGYEVGKPEDWPKEVPYSEDMEKAYRDWAFGLGLNNQQAKGMFENYNKTMLAMEAERVKQENERIQSEIADCEKELKSEFKVVIEKARRVIDTVGGDQSDKARDELSRLKLDNSPQLSRILAKIHDGMSDDTLSGLSSGEGGTGAKRAADRMYEKVDIKKGD